MAPHDENTARITRGLEPALIDHGPVTIGALEASDERSVDVRVAGPAALLAAKAIKLGERLAHADARPDRLKQKDALDAFRIFQAVETDVLIEGFRSHEANVHASTVSAEALDIYREHASTSDGRIVQLAAAAAGGDATISLAFAALVQELLGVL